MNSPTGTGAAMAAEMADQPRALESLLRYRRMPAPPLSEAGPFDGVLLIARGTSDHAATYGRYVLEAALGVPVSLCAPSLWTRYRRSVRLDGYLAIGLSQSGQTPEIANVLEAAGLAGAVTLAITNDLDSPLGRGARFGLELGVGEERAVPATKTFLGQLLALAIIAEALGDAPWSEDDPDRIPGAVQELLGDDALVCRIADELAQARAIVQVGGGYLYAVAQEASLKMIETASFPVVAYSASDLIHGPVAMAGGNVPVVCYSTRGPLESDMQRVAELARERGAQVIWIGEAPPPAVAHHLAVPSVLPEALMPLLHAVRAQQLALSVSKAVGLDADSPQGLRKVTVTL